MLWAEFKILIQTFTGVQFPEFISPCTVVQDLSQQSPHSTFGTRSWCWYAVFSQNITLCTFAKKIHCFNGAVEHPEAFSTLYMVIRSIF